MITSIPFRASHFFLIPVGPSRPFAHLMTATALKAMEKEYCRTFVNRDGRVICVAGVVKIWEGRAEGWAAVHPDIGNDFVGLHRAIKTELKNVMQITRRLEAVVVEGFKNGHKWLKLLGFEKEGGPLRAYFPDGSSGVLYAKVVQ